MHSTYFYILKNQILKIFFFVSYFSGFCIVSYQECGHQHLHYIMALLFPFSAMVEGSYKRFDYTKT